MESCHKIVGSIRNTTLKLCTDWVKQFIGNAQNCKKANLGFCTMVMHQLTHLCLCFSFWSKKKKKKKKIMPQPLYSADLAPADIFLFPKLKTAMKVKGFCYDWGDKTKSKQELLPISKCAFQKYFVDWKNAGIYMRGLLWRGQDSYW